jgi:hypothetical protein
LPTGTSACPLLSDVSIAEGWQHVVFPQCPPMPLHHYRGYFCPAGGCPRPCRAIQQYDDVTTSQLLSYDARGRWIEMREEPWKNNRDHLTLWTHHATYEGERVVKLGWGNGYGEGDIALGYDEDGHLATAGEYTSFAWGPRGPTRIDGHGAIEIVYDAAGRITAHRSERDGSAFGYAYAGKHLLEIREERGELRARYTYHYDERDRLRSIRTYGPNAPDDVFGELAFAYDGADRPIEVVERGEAKNEVSRHRYEYDCR